MKKRIVILGSAGSIGGSALSVIRAMPARFEVAGLAVEKSTDRLLEQAEEFGVASVAVADESAAAKCQSRLPSGTRLFRGQAGVAELAGIDGADIVLCAVVGMAGLRPVLAAIEKGRTVALATKEVLVAAGWIVTAAARRRGAAIIPVDSEHSAILQCLAGKIREPADAGASREVRRIILTASGGPFGGKANVDFDKVTVAEALNHPQWKMGRKVTVDSATLMNKGLEEMEARWLFNMPVDRIDVVIHPESIVHSMVEFVDGTMLAQMSVPDMRFAIQYAFTYPERTEGGLPRLDLAGMKALHFRTPDSKRFPCLGLAREAALRGGTMPAVLNAANEVAVRKFLDGEAPFSGIWRIVERVMTKHAVVAEPSMDDVVESDAWARRAAAGEG